MERLEVGIAGHAGDYPVREAVIDGVLEQAERRLAVALAQLQAGEVVSAERGVGIVGSKGPDIHVMRLHQELFGAWIIAATGEDFRKIAHGRKGERVIRAEQARTGRDDLLLTFSEVRISTGMVVQFFRMRKSAIAAL